MKDPSERRLLTAVVLSLGLLWLWQLFFAPPPPEPTVAEAAAEVAAAQRALEGTPAGAAGAPVAVVSEAACTNSKTTIASATSTLEVSDCGAVRSVRMTGVPSATVVLSWWDWAYDRVTGGTEEAWVPYRDVAGELDLMSNGELLVAGRGAFVLGGTWAVTSVDPLVQERTTSDGFKVVRTIKKGATPETWDVSVRFEADRPLLGPFWVGAADILTDVSGRSSINTVLTAVVDGDLESLPAPTHLQEPTKLDGKHRWFSWFWPGKGEVNWFGFADRFYLVAIAPADPTTAGLLQWARVDAERVGGFLTLPESSLAPGKPIEAKFTVYAGQKDLKKLEPVGHGLDESTSLGMFALFAKFLLITLGVIQDRIGNWGYSILALTLLVRVVTYPLTRSAVVSGRRMSALQPKIKELQEKYADDKETLNREQMALFGKYGVNPLGGCFPMLIQMPVFFALFTALAYEPQLFHARFFYLHDLSSQDPYGFLGAFVVAGMYVQQLMMPPMAGMDPTQAKMMKLMPLVFGLMMFSAPAGLSLYYSLNTVLAVAQQWYNTRSIPPVILDGDANVPT
ncbi:hypothetical protein LBMAG42_31570 [Deltaproteobacteria bacterium]|nr:hypothetical protein LBMAG42_31570 [Deltaproteobacteria bacterium]